VYDLAQLEAALAGTLFAGKLHFSRTTGSTNADALAAASLAAPHGSVYFADEQTTGRGRSDHGWHSAAGEGLYVSVLLRPQISAARLPLLPLAAGLAAAEAIRAVSGLTADLRWPNDLLISTPRTRTYPWGPRLSTPRTKTSPWGPRLGPRKAGGILVEARNDSKRLLHAVVGIGVNVHQRSFPSDLATPATSLDLETGAPSDRSSSLGWKSRRTNSRQALLVALLKSLQREACALSDPAVATTIPSRVERASTWVRGRNVEVHGPQACTGVTAGLDENGFLRVKTANGFVTVQTGGLRAKKD
jgi:BirA family biotin operon repressor/biotin-[acetyl-CoA-carboxylase] ligase